MFNFATSFNQNISDWNTSSNTAMDRMFYGATAFDQNLSRWDVSNVTNFEKLSRCYFIRPRHKQLESRVLS